MDNRDKFLGLVKETLRDDSISMETRWGDLKESNKLFDSMGRSEIIMHLDDVFGVNLWGKSLLDFETVGDVVSYIETERAKKHAAD